MWLCLITSLLFCMMELLFSVHLSRSKSSTYQCNNNSRNVYTSNDSNATNQQGLNEGVYLAFMWLTPLFVLFYHVYNKMLVVTLGTVPSL